MATKTLEKDLMKLERSYWQAIKDGDVDTALSLTDDGCILAGPQGVERINRERFIAMMRNAPGQLRDFQIGSDIQVRQLDDDVAVLAYTVHEELRVDGKPLTVDAAESSTWVRRNGRWACAMHTEAISGDPFGRDRVRTT
ncbi:MAG: nuclear transport factor 2 family protein [Actinobacteria bacterium]|nr:MAG: nuclear transport factor 2 family protein [Actinomycetota bacterium]